MGVNVLPERPDGTIIPTAWFNEIRQLLLSDVVPRNSSGIPENLAGSLGQLLLQWEKLYAREIYLDGQPLETTFLTGRRWKVESGTDNASGYPAYLVPAGTGNGLNATIDVTKDFNALADGEKITLTSPAVFSSLTPAPSVDNTCSINSSICDGSEATKYFGELINIKIGVDAVLDEIDDRDGLHMALLTPTGEVMLAIYDAANSLVVPIIRGYAGTERGVLNDNDVLTLLEINTLLFKNDGFTRIATTKYPQVVNELPAFGVDQSVYITKVDSEQAYSDGTTLLSDYVIVGYAVTDETDCLYTEQIDFDFSYNNNIAFDFSKLGDASIQIKRGSLIGVKNKAVEFYQDEIVDVSANMIGAETILGNTELFIYVSDKGQIFGSHTKPRAYNFFRRGLYHPSNYYRCAGSLNTFSDAKFSNVKTKAISAEKSAEIFTPVGTVLDFITFSGDADPYDQNTSTAIFYDSAIAKINAQISDNWQLCDGSPILDRDSPLFDAATIRHVPNFTDSIYMRGGSVVGGYSTGQKTLSVSELPSHNHSINHGHSLSNAARETHTHSGSDLKAVWGASLGVLRWRDAGAGLSYDTALTVGNSPVAGAGNTGGVAVVGTTGGPINTGSAASVVSHTGNSGNQGSGNSFSIIPKTVTTYKIMRVK